MVASFCDSPMADAPDPYLARILSPLRAALLVVDVQNDFCHEDGLFARLGMDMTDVQCAAGQIEVDYLMREEWAQTADDVLWRRGKLGLRFSPVQVAALENFMQEKARSQLS